SRTHLALDRDTLVSSPISRSTASRIITIPQVGGLHYRYERIAASRVSPRLQREVRRQLCLARLRIQRSLQLTARTSDARATFGSLARFGRPAPAHDGVSVATAQRTIRYAPLLEGPLANPWFDGVTNRPTRERTFDGPSRLHNERPTDNDVLDAARRLHR